MGTLHNTWKALGAVPEIPTARRWPSAGITHQEVTKFLLVFQGFCRFEAESGHFDS